MGKKEARKKDHNMADLRNRIPFFCKLLSVLACLMSCAGALAQVRPRYFDGRNMEGTRKLVLTFDDGPGDLDFSCDDYVKERYPNYKFGITSTENILEVLDLFPDLAEAGQLRAAFFMRGDNMKRFSKTVDLVNQKGHLIANHSYSHQDSLALPRDEQVVREFLKPHEVVRERLNQEMAFMRPPYGSWNDRLVRLFQRHDLFKTYSLPILWNIDSFDYLYKRECNIDLMVSKLKESLYLTQGGIAIFHDIHSVTSPALLKALEWLRSENKIIKLGGSAMGRPWEIISLEKAYAQFPLAAQIAPEAHSMISAKAGLKSKAKVGMKSRGRNSTRTWAESEPKPRTLTPQWALTNADPKVYTKQKYNDFLYNGNSLTVDLSKSLRTIPDSFYGANWNTRSDARIPAEKAKVLGIKFLRIAGPVVERTNLLTGLVALPGTAASFARYQSIEEEIAYTRSIGAEPIVQISVLGRKPTELGGIFGFTPTNSAQDSAALISHLNKTRALGVRYFTVGHDPLAWHLNHSDLFSQPLTATEYLDRLVPVVLAMRKAQADISGRPNDLLISGLEIAQGLGAPLGSDNSFLDSALTMLAAVEQNEERWPNPDRYKTLDYVGLHFFPTFRSDFEDPSSFITDDFNMQNLPGYLNALNSWNTDASNTLDQSLPVGQVNVFNSLSTKIRKHLPKAQLAITQFGIDPAEGIDYHPLLRPLFTAELMLMAAQSSSAHFLLSNLNSPQFHANMSALLASDGQMSPTSKAVQLVASKFNGKAQRVVQKEVKKDANLLTAYASQNATHVKFFTFNRGNRYVCYDLSFIYAANEDPRELIGRCFPPFTMTFMDIPKDLTAKNIKFFEFGSEQINPAFRGVP